MLSPAYDLINTRIHINEPDLALEGGLSYDIPKSEVYEHTGHPCRKDFENFAKRATDGKCNPGLRREPPA